MTAQLSAGPTPAARQAELFSVLAGHLTRHPHLTPVCVSEDDLQLGWVSPTFLEAVRLLEWADSLTGAEFTYSAIKGEAFVFVTGAVDGLQVRVWTVVRDLLATAGLDAKAYNAPLPEDVLRGFAAGMWS